MTKSIRWLLGEAAMVLLLLLVFTQKASAQADWTFMVYLDGDNNLESAGIDDFLEMSSVVGLDGLAGSAVRVVVQFDRFDGTGGYENWTICHRFEITSRDPDMTPIEGNAIDDWGGYPDHAGGREVNMGHPDTLKDFINWAVGYAPAANYALILWNHGSGWRAMMERLKGKKALGGKSGGIDDLLHRSVCIDETIPDQPGATDVLYMYEVRTALNNAPAAPDNIDLLGFDACLMGMTEVAYEVSQSTNPISIVVGSEESEPGDGWPYDDILSFLVATPTMTAATLGTTIVNAYGNYWGTTMGNQNTTQSAIYRTQMDALATAIDNFASAMNSNWAEIKNCRANSQKYYDINNIDLYHFADLVSNTVTNATIVAKAEAVKTAINTAVFWEYHGTGSVANSHGLAIYFPDSSEGYLYERYYEDIAKYDFAKDTGWDEFLKRYSINTFPRDIVTSSWLSVTPTIDGEISPGEWTDATAVNITNTGVAKTVTAYIKNDSQYLYIAIDDPNDDTLTPGDRVGIYFDDDHNHEWDADAGTDEGNYWCIYNVTSWNNQFRGIYYDGTYPYQAADTVAANDITSAGSVAGHMHYEIKIDLTTGALQSSPGSTIGFYFWCLDWATGSYNGEWSKGFNVSSAWQEPLYYGYLTLASISSGGGGGGGGCFIATAAYGTEMAEEVKALKKFRDDVLLKTVAGRDFVELYYAISPPIAKFISHQPLLKAIVRTGLKPLIWFSRLVTE